MKQNTNHSTLRKALVSLALLAAFSMTAGAAGRSLAFAQGRLGPESGRPGYSRPEFERGAWWEQEMRRGFWDGRRAGHQDARNDRHFDPHSYGNEAYREGFRRGDIEGYREARQYPPYSGYGRP